MTLGPPLSYIPVCPEHHVGGPIGYVREKEANGRCPIIAYREPVIAEAFERVRAAAKAFVEAGRET